MMTNRSTGERTFSVLKNWENGTRSAMSNYRLNYLSTMYVESDILDTICIEITDLAEKKGL